ncbi:MAG: pitrilysin family protein [Saprospiraceae bacterium]
MTSISVNHSYTSPVPELNKVDLSNGAELYLTNRGNIPALKLELMFPAGRPYEHKNGLASATLQLIKGGTQKKSATKLAEGFDHWGSSLNFDFYVDNCGIKVFVLEKYLNRILPLFKEMLISPSFPLSELKLFKRQQKEKLRSDESRGDVIAYRSFTEQLFGSKHPYGYNSTIESIEAINREDLMEHYATRYNFTSCKIFLSGSFSTETSERVQHILGHLPSSKIKNSIIKLPTINTNPGHHHIPKADAVQSSIRLGRRLFTRSHPDYIPMYMLNTILGGYYGSRLMQNLRERKGLTYHIYSSLDTFALDGYFLISTEVDKSRSSLAIKEIYKELKRVREQKVTIKEFKTIQRYLKGSFLNYFENVLAQSELVRTLTLEGGVNAYLELLKGIDEMSIDRLQEVANTYLQEKDLTLITVG